MRGAQLVALVLAGCYQPADVASCAVSCDSTHGCPSGLQCDGALCHAAGQTCGGDAGLDAAAFCFTPSMLPKICVPLPLRTLYSGESPINTSDAQSCDVTVSRGSLSDLCVIAADQITIAGYLPATGSRSLVLAARQLFVVSGTIDVSSYFGPDPGAGGTKKCSDHGGDSGTTTGGAGGGGAGGTGGTLGGRGGSDGGGNSGGVPSTIVSSVFDAGQNGGVGGDAAGGMGGTCGIGGGAVYLYSVAQLDLSGNVLALASGGSGGTGANAGGGGGGAGGAIVIDSPGYVPSATTLLGATGAGGGAGSTSSSGGALGSSPNAASINTPAPGGPSPVPGGNGATGAMSRGGMEATNGTDGVGTGGGGGGGGAGVIFLPAGTNNQGTIYPPPG